MVPTEAPEARVQMGLGYIPLNIHEHMPRFFLFFFRESIDSTDLL